MLEYIYGASCCLYDYERDQLDMWICLKSLLRQCVCAVSYRVKNGGSNKVLRVCRGPLYNRVNVYLSVIGKDVITRALLMPRCLVQHLILN